MNQYYKILVKHVFEQDMSVTQVKSLSDAEIRTICDITDVIIPLNRNKMKAYLIARIEFRQRCLLLLTLESKLTVDEQKLLVNRYPTMKDDLLEAKDYMKAGGNF